MTARGQEHAELLREVEALRSRVAALQQTQVERARAERALRESEARSRSLYNDTPVMLHSIGDDGRLVAVNDHWLKVMGYERGEVLGRPVTEFLAKESCPGVLAAIARLRETGRITDHECQLVRRSGELIDVLVSARVQLTEDGRIDHSLAVLTDITARKRAEAALRGSEARLEAALHYRALLEINNAVITHLTQETLCHAVAEALRPVVPFDVVAFSLYQADKGTFRYALIEKQFPEDFFRTGQEVGRSETVSAWVVDHQRAAVRRDLETEQQYSNDRRLLAVGILSYCVVPLISRGKSIGTLNVGSKTKNRYSDADAPFLQEVANQVALAVENMKSYEEIAALKGRLEKENVYLQEEIRTDHNFEEIVGDSPALSAVLRKVEQVAPTNSTVLVYGETGTGKELIARAIHNRSPRKDRPLVKVNCSAISAGLVESELFGHVKGAFTGAIERRVGRFELADGGTIFLDEVGELSLETQVKLLRVLQEREFEPVGGSRSVQVDVRVIAATNRNLEEAVRTGAFRSDLFYRLNVFPLEMPPLRNRASDIPQLAMFFLSCCSKNVGKQMTGISHETMDRLVSYSWPGNVRELENVVERAVILSPGSVLEVEHGLFPVSASGVLSAPASRPSGSAQPSGPAPSAVRTLEEVDRSHIVAVLRETGGVIEGPQGAARILDLHPNTLRHRMTKLGIKPAAHRRS
ncbi:MAG TPA: sigma 54-interacting transcriptional regulator [Gemmatimonadales bacterium]|nr:sigma 54-interacting transcriptional regulator [Gemmatimonadales bacterium]